MSTAPVRKGRGGLPPVTHCRYGHPYDEQNTYTTADGKRYCRTCNIQRNARHYARTHVMVAAAGTPQIRDIPHLDGEPWLDFAAAIVRQSLADYRSTGDDDARDFLVYCGIVDRNGYIRRH